MKTSNKIFTAALIVVFAYLFIYDAGVKAEYRTGKFKSRYYKMEQMNFGAFNAVENNANVLGVQIEKGPAYKVWIKDELKDRVKISKQGSTIHLDYNGDKIYDPFNMTEGIIITCPSISSVVTGNVLIPLVSKKYQYVSYGGATIIGGFTQDSLTLKTGGFTQVLLSSNKLNKLNAQVGDKGLSNANLIIDTNNTLASGIINIPGKSLLNIRNLYPALKIIKSNVAQVKDPHDE